MTSGQVASMASSRRLRLVTDLWGDAVSAVEEWRAGWDLVERLDEDGAALTKAIDNELVMDDLVIDVEWRTEEFQCSLEALDCHIDARAEPSRIGQQDLHQREPPGRGKIVDLMVCVFGGEGKVRRWPAADS